MLSAARARITALIFICSFCLFGLAADPVEAGGGRISLESSPDQELPYRFETIRAEKTTTENNWMIGSFDHFMDLDRDGWQDRVIARNPGIHPQIFDGVQSFQPWQFNLPNTYCSRTPCGSIDGGFDVDGDGYPEVVAISSNAAQLDQRIWALAAADGRLVAETALPAVFDRNEDGKWDGICRVLGVIEADGAGGLPRRAYVTLWGAGFDLSPRGLMAVAVDDGEVLWEFLNGSCPHLIEGELADLEGDGELEIVYTGRGVNNLDGAVVNGFSDDHGTVFVVGQDGGLRWARKLFRGTGMVHYCLMDWDGDGVRDVVAATEQTVGVGNYLVVLDGRDGREMTLAPVPGQIRQVRFLGGAADDPGRAEIIVGTGAILGFRRADGELVKVGEAVSGSHLWVMCADDLLPDPGKEIVAADESGSVWCLSSDFEPRAVWSDPGQKWLYKAAEVIRPEPDTELIRLVSVFGKMVMLDLAESPGGAAPWWLLALLPAAAGAAVALQRRRRPSLSTAGVRERRLHLLDRLELSNHGAIGALRSVRRLVWLLEATRHGGDMPRIRPRITALAEEILQVSLPELTGLLEESDEPVAPRALVGRARQALALIELRLRDMARRGFPESDLERASADLKSAGADAEAALQKVRVEAGGHFRCSPGRILARVLENRALEISGSRIVVAAPESWRDAPDCRIDPAEMSFVLDNLVSNAVKAMAHSDRRELGFAWSDSGGMVELDVSDTGCGIVPDDWERIMATRYSTGGGGMGLPRSREILRKYDGRIYVESSLPGEGSVIRIEIPAAGGAN